ncbi:MAG TPA: hypothetical protein VJ226_00080, partial [Bradyrhizobium sp.]|nr:hypothetical protein [Bradyrhizobium sp.]
MSFVRRSAAWSFLSTTALSGNRREGAICRRSALPGSIAVLTPGVLAGLFCLADPIAARAQDA